MFSLLFSKASKLFLLATFVSISVWAFPTPGPQREVIPNVGAKRDLVARTVTTLSGADISSYTPFTQFARAAYCDPTKIKTWTCGGEC